jgi:hypothetical protein
VHREDMGVGETAWLDAPEEIGSIQLLQNRPDADRGLHITALAHMVDIVLVVDHQGELSSQPRGDGDGLSRRSPDVTRGSQPNRIIPEGFHDHAPVGGRAELAVLALQDGAHDGTCLVPARQGFLAQGVQTQVRGVRIPGCQ